MYLPQVLNALTGQPTQWGMASEKETPEDYALIPPYYIGSLTKAGQRTTNVYKVWQHTRASDLPENSIVQIDIVGPVLKYGDVCSYGSVDKANLINRMAMAGNISGLLINVDSPGGQAAGTNLLATTIKNAGKKKPTIGIVNDGIAASAAMWAISATQETYLTTSTDSIGSIGAYQTIYDFTEFFEKAGVKVWDIYAPQSGDKNGNYRKVIEAGDETGIKAELEVLVNEFISAIKTNRAGRLASKENPFTGKMYNAKDAVDIGLADGIMSYEAVLDRIQTLIDLRKK